MADPDWTGRLLRPPVHQSSYQGRLDRRRSAARTLFGTAHDGEGRRSSTTASISRTGRVSADTTESCSPMTVASDRKYRLRSQSYQALPDRCGIVRTCKVWLHRCVRASDESGPRVQRSAAHRRRERRQILQDTSQTIERCRRGAACSKASAGPVHPYAAPQVTTPTITMTRTGSTESRRNKKDRGFDRADVRPLHIADDHRDWPGGQDGPDHFQQARLPPQATRKSDRR